MRLAATAIARYPVVVLWTSLVLGSCQLLPITIVNPQETAWASWSAGLATTQRIEDEITGKIVRWDRRDPGLMRELVELREKQAAAIEAAQTPKGAEDFRVRRFKLYKQYAEWCRRYAAALEATPPSISAFVFGQTQVSRDLDTLETALRNVFTELLTDYQDWVSQQPKRPSP